MLLIEDSSSGYFYQGCVYCSMQSSVVLFFPCKLNHKVIGKPVYYINFARRTSFILQGLNMQRLKNDYCGLGKRKNSGSL